LQTKQGSPRRKRTHLGSKDKVFGKATILEAMGISRRTRTVPVIIGLGVIQAQIAHLTLDPIKNGRVFLLHLKGASRSQLGAKTTQDNRQKALPPGKHNHEKPLPTSDTDLAVCYSTIPKDELFLISLHWGAQPGAHSLGRTAWGAQSAAHSLKLRRSPAAHNHKTKPTGPSQMPGQ
jgi:hypothetical protein